MTERILVVEDSPTQARTLKATLEGAGYGVTVASNGEEALEHLVGQQFDLVISDIVMPGIDGYEVCRRIKSGGRDLPVMLLTSLTDPLEVVRGLSAGADNFLHKPYESDYLLGRIRTILFNRELRRQGKAQMGLELFFLGQRFMITADRQQILDLLVTTFEDLVGVNQQLRERERELAEANEDVSNRLEEIELERQRLGTVLANVPQGLVMVDAEGIVVEANESYGQLFGTPSESLVGREAATARFVDRSGTVIAPGNQPLARTLAGEEAAALGTAFDLFLEAVDGSRVPVIARAVAIRDGDNRTVGAVGVLEEIGGLLSHDPVTGLLSHAVFADRVVRAVELSSARSGVAAVMVVAIDRFDRLRNSLAPAASDELVAEIAGRLEALLEDGDADGVANSAAYLGNGEFAVVAPGLTSDIDAVRVGHWLRTSLRGSVPVEKVDVTVSMSVGVALAGAEHDARHLVSVAATTARRAGAAGGDRVMAADEAVHIATAGRLRVEEELRAAMTAGDLAVYYQPQVLLGSGRVVGAEALVRWQHPERGLVPAYEFIPVAQDAGLIAELSWWVLEEACRQAATWRAELSAAQHFALSVNLAPEQLGEAGVTDRVRSTLETTGLDPSGLVLEITETGVMSDPDTAREHLEELKALGVRVAIDDFGTGYSSLMQLRQFPVDIVKIDRTFVAGLLSNDEDGAIVAGTTRLAHALGLEVVAEGIEDDEQLVRLRVLGCEVGQGYRWAPALPPGEFGAWWDAQARVDAEEDERTALVTPDEFDGRRDDALAYLVHELVTPLAAVVGFSELLAAEVPHGPARDYVDAVLRSARDLDSRIGLLREGRDVREGRLHLETRRHDMTELVRTLVDDLTPQLHPHEVTFDAEGSFVADVDADRVVQGVTNLLSNAAKFSPEDALVHVTVRGNDAFVEVAVCDEGPGVPEHRRPELFRRFARLGAKNSGMGIGLYLSRMIAVAHGGSIRYEPAPSGGACFVLSFPGERATDGRSDPIGERLPVRTSG